MPAVMGTAEAFDDQPEAKRQLPQEDRDGRDRRQTVTGSLPRNNAAIADEMSSGAPMSPSTGMTRGASLDLCLSVWSRSADGIATWVMVA